MKQDCRTQYYKSTTGSIAKLTVTSIAKLTVTSIAKLTVAVSPNSRCLSCQTHGGCLAKLTMGPTFPSIILLQNFGVPCLASQNHPCSFFLFSLTRRRAAQSVLPKKKMASASILLGKRKGTRKGASQNGKGARKGVGRGISQNEKGARETVSMLKK